MRARVILPDKRNARQVPITTTIKPAVEIPILTTKAKKHAREVPQSQNGKYAIIGHLKRFLAFLIAYDALQMSKELRGALIMALSSSKLFKTSFESAEMATTLLKY